MGRTGMEGCQIMVRELNLPISVEQFASEIDEEYRKIFSEYVPLMPGAERLVKHLASKRVPIAIATSSKGFTFRLKTKPHKELFSNFHHILVASEDPEIVRGKPDPQTFLVCASRFSNPPTNMSNVLVFEDSVAGVQAANAAGMKSVWVPDPRMSKDLVTPWLQLNTLEEFKPELYGLPAYD